MSPEPAQRPSVRREALFLAAAMTVAFLLRLVTLPALTQGGLRLLTPDDYGHLRRAAAAVRDFPRLPVFDPYLNHPDGGIWIWPPLFDLAIAAPARLLFGAEASVGQVAVVAAWLPPVLGALALLPLFFLTARAFGRTAARIAALTYAILPGAIAWSNFGHPDQHAGEALAFLATLAGFARLLGPPGPDEPSRWKAPALAGGALGLAVLTWQGSLFLAPLVGGAAFLAGRSREAGQAIAVAALLVAPFALLTPSPVTYVSFSAFHPLFLGLCAALLLLAAYGWPGRIAAVALGLGALAWPPVLNGVLHLLGRTATGEITSGGYLSYSGDWLRLIGEYQPLLAGGLGPPLTQLSPALFLVPVALYLWGRRAWRSLPDRGLFLLLTLATAGVLVMTLLQRRYLYYLAPLVALVLADLTVRLGRRGGSYRAVAMLLMAAALLPTFPALTQLTAAPGAPGSDFLLTLARLGALDPPVQDPLRPGEVRPGEVEGVMAPWSIGHTAVLLTRRPAVADNFGYGFHRQARLFTTPPAEDAAAFRLLQETRCKYLITTDLRPVLPAYAQAAGRSGVPPEAMLAVRVHESDSPRPLSFLRLVLTSESAWPTPDGRLVARWKVFRIALPAG